MDGCGAPEWLRRARASANPCWRPCRATTWRSAWSASSLNAFGDLVYQACGTTMLTPSGMVLQEGEGLCVRCARDFWLLAAQAATANQRAEEFRRRVALELLRV